MSVTAIFPLALWQEGTNQNATPANDNALRLEALFGPALGFAGAAPSTPADHDQYVVSVAWGGHDVGNIVINLGGTWKEFGVWDAMTKAIGGLLYLHQSGDWVPFYSSGS